MSNTIKIGNKEIDLLSYDTEVTKKKYMESFGETNDIQTLTFKYNVFNIDGFRLEISGPVERQFKVEVFEPNGNLYHETILSTNMWTQLNKKYFIPWRYVIRDVETKQVICDNIFSLENERVFINFESKSLGDNIAWIPYCEEFRKKHKCTVIVSTFWNRFFEDKYPNIEFVNPGSVVYDIRAQYRIGWFDDNNKEPQKPNLIPLQKSATNILGLDFEELKPKISFKRKKVYDFKYVTIATHSTAGLKYWNHPTGWKELVSFIKSKGYEVVHVSMEPTDLSDVIQLEDTSMENTMSVIDGSELFIGLSSGLSWLSWALGKHVVMISNFTEDDHEFTTNTTRITNHKVCNGCWNNPMFKFDKGDWYWCPEHKGTPRQFECHKSITPGMVINEINRLLS